MYIYTRLKKKKKKKVALKSLMLIDVNFKKISTTKS